MIINVFTRSLANGVRLDKCVENSDVSTRIWSFGTMILPIGTGNEQDKYMELKGEINE